MISMKNRLTPIYLITVICFVSCNNNSNQSPATEENIAVSVDTIQVNTDSFVFDAELDMQEEENPMMSEKEGLCFFLKVYNLDPDYNINTKKIDENNRKYKPGWFNNWTKEFLERTDSYNYKQLCNDEFKYADYLNTANLELKKGIEVADFNKKYSIVINSKLGEYDFANQSFPLSIDLEDADALFSRQISDNTSSGVVTIRKMVNSNEFEHYNDYQFKFSINQSDASKFIESRKNINNGYVDRIVYIRIIYNVVNMQVNDNYKISPFDYCTGLAINVSTIEIWSDEYCSEKKLGEIKRTI